MNYSIANPAVQDSLSGEGRVSSFCNPELGSVTADEQGGMIMKTLFWVYYL